VVLQWLYRTCVCCREEDEEEEDEDEDEEEEREAVDAEDEDKAEEVEEVEVAVGEPVESPPVVGYTNKTKTTSLADKEEQHLVKTAADLVAVTELSQAVEEEKEGKGEEVEKEGAEKEQGEKEDGEEEEEEEEIAVSDVAQVSRTLWHHMWLVIDISWLCWIFVLFAEYTTYCFSSSILCLQCFDGLLSGVGKGVRPTK